jgi:hypothetical protein
MGVPWIAAREEARREPGPGAGDQSPGSGSRGRGSPERDATVQLLTVSSQIKNPLTAGGRVVDVFLEIWALFVVTAIAGSFAAFFGSGDA